MFGMQTNDSIDAQEHDENESDDDYSNEFQFRLKEKNKEEMQFLLMSLKNHFIFYNLSQAQLQSVAKSMMACSVPQESYICKKGSQGKWFFIVHKGIMEVHDENELKNQLKAGDAFGQIFLLYKSQLNFSVKAIEDCSLWGINRKRFRNAVQKIIMEEFNENKLIIESIPFLNSLSMEQKQMLASDFIIQKYQPNQVIVEEGQPGSAYFIIKEGSVTMWKNDTYLRKLNANDTFGQKALFYNIIRQTTVKADEETTCLILTRERVQNLLGDDIYRLTYHNFLKKALFKTEYISQLDQIKIEQIIEMMKVKILKEGEVVVHKEITKDQNKILFVVIEGIVGTANSSEPYYIQSQVYGENQLEKKQSQDVDIQSSLVMKTYGMIAEISTHAIMDLVGGPHLNVIIAQNFMKNRQSVIKKMKSREKNVKSFDELVKIKDLQENCFGPTFLVGSGKQSQANVGKLYELRCYSKKKVVEEGYYQYLQRQNTFLGSLCFPFIVELYKTIKDEHFLYSLVQFVKGEDLYQAIRTMGLLSSSDAKFYIASIIIILEYLRKQQIMQRDISPQCFIVDEKGFLRLKNMTSAIRITSSKTKTLIGSPYYTAPQMIEGQGYTHTVSLFSLGILLYEFLCGFVPFGQKSNDPIQIYEDILNSQVQYPAVLKDIKAKKLMDQLLNKKIPESRLGGPTFNSLKKNPWFNDFSWSKLQDQKMEPPSFSRTLNVSETEIELQENLKDYEQLEEFLKVNLIQVEKTSSNKVSEKSVKSHKFDKW